MIVCITGASSGIGEATARAFAKQGESLILGARREAKLKGMVEPLLKLGAAAVHVLPLDVRNEVSVETFGKSLAQIAPQGLDLLVNNAGLALGSAKVAEGSFDEWATMLDTNVFGVLRVTRLLLPQMIKNRRGHIIMVGSIAATQVYEGGSVYCASKHALRAITQTLKLELNGQGVRVSSIDPGMVETEFSLVRFNDASRAKSVYEGIKPLTGEDIANCIAFIANCPAHVNIDTLQVTPLQQATVYKVNRNSPNA